MRWCLAGALAVNAMAQRVEFQPLIESKVLERFEQCPPKNAERLERLKAMFVAAGCDVKEDRVAGSPPNVVCTLKGESDETILVGAHYDLTGPGSGGCADNWSGASVLPSLYESLAQKPRFHTYQFIGFSDEEKGLVGSRSHAGRMSKEDLARTAAMVNIDTIGLTPTKVWMSRCDPALRDTLLRLGAALKIPIDGVDVERVGSTDSEPYRLRGIKTIAIHSLTQETFPILHTKRDQLAAVNRQYLYETYRLLAAYLVYLDGKLRPEAKAERLESLTLKRTIPLHAELDHVQGVDVEGGRAWVSSVDRKARKGWLHIFDLSTGKASAQVEVRNGEKFHPGGITLDGEFVWVPVAEYDRNGPTLIQKRNKNTLQLVSEFLVRDHIGCVAKYGRLLYAGNWDAKKLYSWTLEGAVVSERENTFATRYQDLKFDGLILVGSGLRGKDEGSIDWLDPDTLRPVRRIEAGKTDRGVVFTHEGMAIRDGTLYLLPEDGPSRLFLFELTR